MSCHFFLQGIFLTQGSNPCLLSPALKEDSLPAEPLGKEMATHSSVLAWRIPGTEEAGGLPSMGSHRVGHD